MAWNHLSVCKYFCGHGKSKSPLATYRLQRRSRQCWKVLGVLNCRDLGFMKPGKFAETSGRSSGPPSTATNFALGAPVQCRNELVSQGCFVEVHEIGNNAMHS